MVELVIPPALDQAQVSIRYVDPSGASASRYTGAVQTTSYGGDRVGAAIDFSPCGGGSLTGASRRAQLKAFLMALRGRQNRVYLTDTSSPRRGAFSATEIFANSDFSGGPTGWSATAGGTLSVADGALRVNLNGVAGSREAFQSIAVQQGIPFAVRSIIRRSQGLAAANLGCYTYDGTVQVNSLSTSDGYRLSALVPGATTSASNAAGFMSSPTSGIAGDYYDLLFASAARCMLVDGGGNSLLYSDDITNAAWSKSRTTATANSHTAPDGTATGDKLTEDTANNSHILVQSVARANAAADLCVYGYFLRSAGTRDVALYVGNDSSNYSFGIFTLTGTNGTATLTGNVGTATNGRVYIRSAGNGWYFCCLVARLPAAATLYTQYGMVQGGTNTSYTGDGSSAIGTWRLGAIPSSVPTRGAQTTTVAVAAASQTGGNGLYVKGGRGPTEGALKDAIAVGDWVEIDGQLCAAEASFDLDAAGTGFIKLSPPPRKPVADNTPIIVHKPMGRFMYTGDALGWNNEPGLISSAQIELVQAFAA